MPSYMVVETRMVRVGAKDPIRASILAQSHFDRADRNKRSKRKNLPPAAKIHVINLEVHEE